jgi:hypothetical protein
VKLINLFFFSDEVKNLGYTSTPLFESVKYKGKVRPRTDHRNPDGE